MKFLMLLVAAASICDAIPTGREKDTSLDRRFFYTHYTELDEAGKVEPRFYYTNYGEVDKADKVEPRFYYTNYGEFVAGDENLE
ncbi:hypothetical protein C8R43DRAFT_39752 [Mycena crocata]|nr:hypothetical protein C8R43DRAFT_39752 [Mycena crocata]